MVKKMKKERLVLVWSIEGVKEVCFFCVPILEIMEVIKYLTCADEGAGEKMEWKGLSFRI